MAGERHVHRVRPVTRQPPLTDGLTMGPFSTLTLSPIGVVRSPFVEKLEAPRQGTLARGVKGTIELAKGRGLEHAVLDLEAWDHIWVVFWFHLNTGWKPKVLPPRSKTKRGVLSTRSPHRPNPIGLSVVKLESIDGLTLHIADLDIVDGSPVLDIKPYVSYADSFPNAKTGWVDSLGSESASADAIETVVAKDPDPGFDVTFSEHATRQATYLATEHGIALEGPIGRVLALGPEPHPYRRIRRDGDTFRLAWKSWRARFRVQGRSVLVVELETGYRKRELERADDLGSQPPDIEAHRAFVARFRREEGK